MKFWGGEGKKLGCLQGSLIILSLLTEPFPLAIFKEKVLFVYVGVMSEVRRNDGVCGVVLPRCLLHTLAGAKTFEMCCLMIILYFVRNVQV